MQIKKLVKQLEADLATRTTSRDALALELPNTSHPSSPIGDESVARVIRTYGPAIPDPPPPANPALDHLSLSSPANLAWTDFPSSSLISGPSWPLLTNTGALLELALTSYAMSIALSRGFAPVLTPDVVRSDVAERCGFRPRDGDAQQTYFLSDGTVGGDTSLCLVGTAEVPLVAMSAATTFRQQDLPLKRVALGRAFRAEAGARGAESRGLYRVHQFSKVEMVVVCAEEDSGRVLEELRSVQEQILASLGLSLRVLEMPTQELGASAHRKYDIEAWMPGPALEATAGHPQLATGPAKVTYAHTLNATAAAIPRLIVALLENGAVLDGEGEVERVRLPAMYDSGANFDPSGGSLLASRMAARPNGTDPIGSIPFHAESCHHDLAEQDRKLRALKPVSARALVDRELAERDRSLRDPAIYDRTLLERDLAQRDLALRTSSPLDPRAEMERELRERDRVLRSAGAKRSIDEELAELDRKLRGVAPSAKKSSIEEDLAALDVKLRAASATKPASSIDADLAELDRKLRALAPPSKRGSEEDDDFAEMRALDTKLRAVLPPSKRGSAEEKDFADMKALDRKLRAATAPSKRGSEEEKDFPEMKALDTKLRAIARRTIDEDLAAEDTRLRAMKPDADAAARSQVDATMMKQDKLLRATVVPASSPIPESVRQLKATNDVLIAYQGILLGMLLILTVRNIVQSVKRRIRKRKLAVEATGPITSANFKRLEAEYSQIPAGARLDKWLYLPLKSNWWCGLENPLQLCIFVFFFAIHVAFILIIDTDFRGPEDKTWNTIHAVALRCGFLALAQFPAIFALTGRNSVVQSLTGIEYQHLRFVHKLLACWMGLLAVIHTIDASVAQLVWVGGKGVAKLYGESYLGKTGIAMLVGLVCIMVFSIRRVRMMNYEVFLIFHILGAILMVVGLHYHAPSLVLYTWLAIGFWIYERLTRVLQLFTNRRLRFRAPLVQARAVLIEGAIVLRVPFKGTWKPGQHAYLSFWDSAFIRTPNMFCQQHPFSIANVPGSSETDASGKIHEMMFVLKTRDGMTSILEKKLQTSNTGMMPLWVAVEGPYGGSVDTEQFDEVLLVAGGSGITHCTSVLADVIHKAKTRRSRTRVRIVKLVWTVQSVEQSIWELTLLLKNVKKAYDAGVQLKVDLFVTRGFFNTAFAPPATDLDEKGSEGMDVEGPSTGPCPMTPRTVAADLDQIMSENPMSTAVHIIPGRPRVDTLVPNFIQEARGRSLVVACGPTQMTADVRSEVSKLMTVYPVQMEMAVFEC
ncbi:hypothetical protein RQP46_008423 [Phenoliferia psychrophenolica]